MCVYRLPCWLSGKGSTGNAGDTGEAGSGRSPGGGHGNLLQYSCLGFSRQDREAWQATVHRATKSQTGLKQRSMHARVWECVCVCVYLWRVKVLVTQLCSTFCNSMDCNQPGSFVHGILQARILEWVAMPSSRGFFQPRSPSLQTDSLPSEPPGKPKNTGVGSLSLFQGIFPTQESNWGLLHCSMPHWRSIPDILPTVKGRDEGLLWRSRG